MSRSVTITLPRDRFPAQRCLLLALVTTALFSLPGVADARSKGKPAPANPPAVVPAKTIAANPVTPASLRATTNDAVAARSAVQTPSGTTVGKAAGAATADALSDTLPSATPQRPKDWYPESHSYLRPYHYKWRYWTPG